MDWHFSASVVMHKSCVICHCSPQVLDPAPRKLEYSLSPREACLAQPRHRHLGLGPSQLSHMVTVLLRLDQTPSPTLRVFGTELREPCSVPIVGGLLS